MDCAEAVCLRYMNDSKSRINDIDSSNRKDSKRTKQSTSSGFHFWEVAQHSLKGARKEERVCDCLTQAGTAVWEGGACTCEAMYGNSSSHETWNMDTCVVITELTLQPCELVRDGGVVLKVHAV